MPEHFTLATVSAEFYCGKCGHMTQHRIDTRRKGPCLECIARLEKQKAPLKVEVRFKFQPAVFGPMCTCRSFRFGHLPEDHKKLKSDMDWRTYEQRMADSDRVTYWEPSVR